MNQLKLFFLAILLGLIPDMASAAVGDKFTLNGIMYNVTSESPKEVEVVANSSVSYKYYGDIVIPSTANEYSVTSIGEEAFDQCDMLYSVSIPNSVTTIGEAAFWNCENLTTVTISNGLTSIGGWAFDGCYNLASITLPNSVVIIGECAFQRCFALASITIPNSVTSIGGGAFGDCSGLTSITIPNSVTSIGSNPFSGCSNLTSIIVESGNTKYDSRNSCNAIIDIDNNRLIAGCKNTVIPNSVTSIGGGAFGDCSGLTSITIPNSVTSIGDYAFLGCSGLTSITIPNGITSIGNSTFSNCGFTSITIPNNVTSIGESAFSACSNLTSITIPNSVTSIGESAFSSCSGLTSVIIGNSVASIGNNAFRNCSGLTFIVIPNSVTTIGGEAFRNCTNLASVTIYANTVPSLGGSVFYNNYVDQKINVFSDLVIHYKGQWSTYASKIEAITLANHDTNTGDYWSTYYYSGSDVLVDNNTTVYTVSVNGSTAILNEVEDKRIKAGEAVVLKSTAATTTLSSTTAVDDTYYGSNDLQGVDVATATSTFDGKYIYTLAGGSSGDNLGFYKYYPSTSYSNTTLTANKAFLVLDAEASAREFYLFDEGTTSIQEEIDMKTSGNEKYYDLQGRTIIHPTKGLYILNGKKVVIK